MNVDAIKDLMNKCLITEVVDPVELAKMSDNDIRANYITQVVDLPDFTNDDIEVPTEESTDEPSIEPIDDENGDEPVVDEGDENIEDPEEVEGGDI